MSLNPRRTVGEPHDRLTRIGDAMLDALSAHPEYLTGDKALVLLDHDHEGAVAGHGYEDDNEVITNLIRHLQAMLELRGASMQIHTIPKGAPDAN